MKYVTSKKIGMKAHPDFNEDWVQALIAEDPSLLGLGDLELLARERRQPKAGTLDLLLRDPDSLRRYEVEVQLGSTDESHIIRTLEYWDIERKRFPDVEHCAVIVAEDITSRFLNVVSLFNGHIPLIAIKMEALKVAEYVTLNFTTVLDELVLGDVAEDEERAVPTDRSYWEARSSTAVLEMVDQLLQIVRKYEPTAELRFNKNYIGLTVRRRAFNFVEFKPKQKFLKMEFRIPKSSEIDSMIEDSGVDAMAYDRTWQHYRLRLRPSDISEFSNLIEDLTRKAHIHRTGTGRD